MRTNEIGLSRADKKLHLFEEKDDKEKGEIEDMVEISINETFTIIDLF